MRQIKSVFVEIPKIEDRHLVTVFHCKSLFLLKDILPNSKVKYLMRFLSTVSLELFPSFKEAKGMASYFLPLAELIFCVVGPKIDT